MRFAGEAAHDVDRVGDQIADRQGFVDDAIDERGVRAILEQAAHQIRQQVFVRADRRVDAAGHVQMLAADHFVVQVRAHAVQALEFERAAVREWIIAAMVCALCVANAG